MSKTPNLFGDDEEFDQELDQEAVSVEGGDDADYEEICSDEVDRIVQALEELMGGVESENIRAYLEEAADNIFSLVYEAEDFDAAEENSGEAGADIGDELAA